MTSPSLSLRITLLVQVLPPQETPDSDPDPEPAADANAPSELAVLSTAQVAALVDVTEAEVARASRRRRMVGGRFTLEQVRDLVRELRGAQRAEAA